MYTVTLTLASAEENAKQGGQRPPLRTFVAFPLRCACCYAPAEGQRPVPVRRRFPGRRAAHIVLMAPYCARCAAHCERYSAFHRSRCRTFVTASLVAAVSAVGAGAAAGWPVLYPLGAVGAVGALVYGATRQGRDECGGRQAPAPRDLRVGVMCAAAGDAVRCARIHAGQLTLQFANPSFAQEFAELHGATAH